MPTIITENDKSNWEDVTGVRYHFPKRYLPFLQPGNEVIYYKGSLKNIEYAEKRKSKYPHYFGWAKVERVYPDSESKKNDYYCELKDYKPFKSHVLAKIGGEFIEPIPENRISNYWRDGVREINKEVFDKIIQKSI